MALVFAVFEVAFDFLILHLVLQGPDFQVGRGLHHDGNKFVVDVLVHVDAFGSHTGLTRVAEGAPSYLRGDGFDVDIRADDHCIVTASTKEPVSRRKLDH